MSEYGLVNRILPFSCVDGPGNRSAIFLQGCDFQCRYCHNPETQNLCIGCGACVKACPVGALSIQNGKISWNSQLCQECDTCLNICKNNSSPKVRKMTVEDVFQELENALPFVTGITVSGGECTRYPEFLVELFQRASKIGKTTFVDTNGQNDFQNMPALTKQMDMAMLDVKAWEEEEHLRLTGVSNKTVLKNLDYLASLGKLYEVRTVILPDYLDNENTVRKVSQHIAAYPQVRYKLIKFRPWGVRPPLDVVVPDDTYMKQLAQIARNEGIQQIELT